MLSLSNFESNLAKGLLDVMIKIGYWTFDKVHVNFALASNGNYLVSDQIFNYS